MACTTDAARAAFVQDAVNDHIGSKAYAKAQEAQAYYDGENPTIMKLEKMIYDYKGMAHRDLYSANHKIASSFFGMVVDQEVSYLLRNGITWTEKDTGKRLGRDFHRRVADILESGAIAGRCWGYWNFDHLEVFYLCATEEHPGFAPILGKMDGKIHAGVRFWRLGQNEPYQMTLYEPDGITEFAKDKNDRVPRVVKMKYPFISRVRVQKSTGIVLGEEPGENYPGGLPIFEFQYKKNGKSEMQGHRNTVDALDLVTSNMVNNVDEGNLIYWILTNCGGMDEDDDAAFLQQLKITHVVHADGDSTSDQEAKAEAHSVEAPFEGTDKAIERLESRLYKDFRAFNEAAIESGNQTATAIKASYVPLDMKTDKNEDNISDFIAEILAFLGIDDEPTYTRNKIINTGEEVQTVLSAGNYLGDEYTTRKVLTILGDADQFDDVQRQKDAEAADRYKHIEEQLGQQAQGKEGEDE